MSRFGFRSLPRFAARLALVVSLPLVIAACTQPAQRGASLQAPIIDPRASAAERDASTRRLVDHQNQVFRASLAIFAAATDYCPVSSQQRVAVGFTVWNDGALGNGYRADLNRLYGLTTQLLIRAVAPGLPADVAGLQPGDAVLQVGNQPIPPDLSAFDAFQAGFSNDMADEQLSLTIQRDSQRLEGALAAVPVCNLDARPVAGQIADTALDADPYGDVIVITDDMVDLAGGEDGLAAVIAYDVARWAQNRGQLRLDPQDGEQDRLFGLPPGQTSLDRAAIQMMATAERDPEAVIALLQRLASQPPQALTRRWQQTLPPARIAYLRQIIADTDAGGEGAIRLSELQIR